MLLVRSYFSILSYFRVFVGPNNKVGKKVHFGAIWSNFGPKWIACIWSKWDGHFWCFKKGFNTCKNLNNEVEVWKCADIYT